MALKKELQDPYERPGVYFESYIWTAETNFNWASKTGRIVFFIHKSEEAARAIPPVPPIDVLTIDLTPTGTAEVKDENGVVLRQRIPSFDEIIFSNAELVMELGEIIYNFGMTYHPALEGAVSLELETPPSPEPEDPDSEEDPEDPEEYPEE